jgi:hypothetical protein
MCCLFVFADGWVFVLCTLPVCSPVCCYINQLTLCTRQEDGSAPALDRWQCPAARPSVVPTHSRKCAPATCGCTLHMAGVMLQILLHYAVHGQRRQVESGAPGSNKDMRRPWPQRRVHGGICEFDIGSLVNYVL